MNPPKFSFSPIEILLPASNNRAPKELKINLALQAAFVKMELEMHCLLH